MGLAQQGGLGVTICVFLIALATFVPALVVSVLYRTGTSIGAIVRRPVATFRQAFHASQLQIALGALLVLPYLALAAIAWASIRDLLALPAGMIVCTLAIAFGTLLGTAVGWYRLGLPRWVSWSVAGSGVAVCFAILSLSPHGQVTESAASSQSTAARPTPAGVISADETAPPTDDAPAPTKVATKLPYRPGQVTIGNQVLRTTPICVEGMGATPVSVSAVFGVVSAVLPDGTPVPIVSVRELLPCTERHGDIPQVLHAPGHMLRELSGGTFLLYEDTALAPIAALTAEDGTAYVWVWHYDGSVHTGLLPADVVR